MYDSPVALKDYCLDYIRDSLTAAIQENEDTNGVLSYFKSNAILTSNISENLLISLSNNGQLNDGVMVELFKSPQSRLEKVCIPDASGLTTKGLRVLRNHKIDEISTINLTKITINDLIGCLGDWTLHNLRYLNVACSSFTNSSKVNRGLHFLFYLIDSLIISSVLWLVWLSFVIFKH